jgi:flagellar hook-basal body complex protein FliE
MALNISTLSSALVPNSAQALSQLALNSASRYTADSDEESLVGALGASDFSIAGLSGSRGSSKASEALGAVGSAGEGSFEKALLKAMDGVSDSQAKSDDLLQRVVADPDSVDAQDVTIAMAEANMSLNLAKTIMSRIVTAWKDVINTR